MATKPKINRDTYHGASDDVLNDFTQSLVTEGLENPVYEEQKTLIEDVETFSGPFNDAVVAANSYGGTDRTKAKANTRKPLIEKLDTLVNALEAVAPTKEDPEAFLTGLGFELVKKPTRHTGIVAAPILGSAVSGGKNAVRGKVRFILKAENPLEIKTIIGKRSDDGGKTWVNGLVAAKLNFTLTNQPSGVDCIYQFMFLATNNRESGWSANIPVGVY